MLIISDFHDYYDRAAVYGVDKTVVYRRKTELLPFTQEKSKWNRDHRCVTLPDSSEYHLHECIVGYCGQLFPLIRIITQKSPTPKTPILAYGADEFAAWVESLGELNFRRYFHGGSFLKREFYQRYFNADLSRFNDLFVKHRTPLFLFNFCYSYGFGDGPGDITLHPNLHDLDFQRHKDAPTAFQDIFMYLSGVLGAPENPTIQLTNEMIQAKHGLDGKYSFKKPPGKKTRWR